MQNPNTAVALNYRGYATRKSGRRRRHRVLSEVRGARPEYTLVREYSARPLIKGDLPRPAERNRKALRNNPRVHRISRSDPGAGSELLAGLLPQRAETLHRGRRSSAGLWFLAILRSPLRRIIYVSRLPGPVLAATRSHSESLPAHDLGAAHGIGRALHSGSRVERHPKTRVIVGDDVRCAAVFTPTCRVAMICRRWWCADRFRRPWSWLRGGLLPFVPPETALMSARWCVSRRGLQRVGVSGSAFCLCDGPSEEQKAAARVTYLPSLNPTQFARVGPPNQNPSQRGRHDQRAVHPAAFGSDGAGGSHHGALAGSAARRLRRSFLGKGPRRVADAADGASPGALSRRRCS